jgi:predicted outer membrane repeat protein
LYSADALSLAMSLGTGDFSNAGAAWTQPAAALALASSDAVTTQGVEIVVLDTSVADSASMLADLLAQQRAGRHLEVLTLNAGEDGIARITDLLAQRNHISALHVLGHGADGMVLLGGSQLNSATLLARAGEIATWGRAFSADADFLIYGCDVAAGATGLRLVSDLAALTGADVAASTDTTASSLRGGDWLLEDQTGHIEAASALSSAEQQSYSGSLATIAVTRFTDDNNPGSLRWAITQANTNGGADSITLSAGTYVLTLANVGVGGANSWRDFDIASDVSIVGAGAGQTVIESQGSWRHFEVSSGSLNLAGVTLRGGSQTSTDTNSEESRGGSINVRSGATLVLSQSIIENSSAQNGGAICVAGTATLTDVELRNNIARNDGGGVHDTGNTTLSHVTVAQNVALHNGGGIYKSGSQLMTLSNLTLSGNGAGNVGGGLYSSAGTSGGGNSGSNSGSGNDVTNVKLVNASVVSNSAFRDGGGLYLDSDTQASVANSLFASNSSVTSQRWTHANKNLQSAGYNLYDLGGDGLSFGMIRTGDHATSDIKLAALANNGGITRTHALQFTSDAINAASNSLAPSTDQRNVARQGAADIGAFEYINATPSLGNVTLTIGAGGTAGLTLNLVDIEGDEPTVDVVSVTHGKFTLSTDPTRAITAFSGSDFFDGKVRFVHDGTSFAPTITLRARDDLSTSANKAGTVYFTPANSAPVNTGSLTLSSMSEDTFRSITQAQLLGNTIDINGDPLVVSNLQVLTAGAGTLTPTTIPAVTTYGLGTGLKGEYHNINIGLNPDDISLSGTPALTRTEGIDFNWADGAPGPGVANDHFAVRWSGYIVPPASGKYTLRTESDDGIRVWVNGNLLIDAWDWHQPQANESLQVDLQAGTAYTIKVEYFEDVRGATARLQWQTPGSSTFSAIPTARLFDAAPTPLPEWRFAPNPNYYGTVNFSYNVSDGRGGPVAAAARLVVTSVNDTPSITLNTLSITEGGNAAPRISTSDPDGAANTLILTPSSITHGRFALSNNLSGTITEFTQQQVNDGVVRFVHDGSSFAPSYRLTVKDASNATSTSQAAAVTFTAVNDLPVFVNNTLKINNGASAVPLIVATDEDNSATALTFTATNVTGGGFFIRTGANIAPTTSFTQQAVNDGRVSFVHDGLGNPPSYDLSVSDGSATTALNSALIEFNNPNATPVLTSNTLTLLEGDVATPVISTTDTNDGPDLRVITATEVTGGHFVYSTAPTTPVTSFRQLDVDLGVIRFVHDGSETQPSYRLTVSDPSGASATSLADVTFSAVNDAPVLVVNALSIEEGGTALPWIEASDEETDPALLIFNVSNVSGGQFESANAEGAGITQFTQAQIDSGEVRFVANGGELAPAYSLSVFDGTATSTPVAVNLQRFTHVNDRPVFTQNSLTVSEGGIAKPTIRIADPDNSSDQLRITVTDLRGGHFELTGALGPPVLGNGPGSVVLEVIDSFTVAQLKFGEISFVHDGSEQTPSYTLTVTDSDGATDISVLSNVGFTPVNDLPYFDENSLVIREGGIAVPNIKLIDPDNAAADLRISVTEVNGGRFELIGDAGQAITGFTQSQIDQGLVRFVDGGQGTAPSYTLTATDPALRLTGNRVNVPRSVGSVTFTALNDAPVFTSNRLEITEGDVARPSINVTDEDHKAAQITITVTALSGGRFEFISAKEVPVLSFTQADLDAGSVRFVHDGSGAAPRYTLTATDADGAQSGSTLSDVNFTAVNDKPALVLNALTVTEGGVAVPQIQVSDEDNSAAELRFSVSALQGGRFELISAPGVAISQFTQAQLDAGVVRFVHDGSETVPGYALSVADVEGAQATSAGPRLAYTPVNDAPLILSNQLRILEAGFALPVIQVSDVDTAGEQLKFSVSAVSGGHFERVGAPGVDILNFTQAQVDAGAVRFVHDGSFDAPRYRLALSDGDNVVYSDAAITFTRLPPPPPALVITPTTAPATTTTSNASATPPTADSTAAKPASTSAADVLVRRAAAADAAAADAAAAEAQASTQANSQATAGLNRNAAASSSSPYEEREAREGAARNAASASNNNAGAGVEVDSRWATASVATGSINIQNLLLSGDTNSLDWSSSSSSLLDRKLLDAVLGSSDSALRNTALDKAFERIREELDQGAQADGQAVAGSLVLSTSFSVGYVLWLARGGVLLASMASSIPAWATVDPLPVLSRFKARQGEGDDGFGGPDDGNANPDKADALERLFSKAKKVFSGHESAPAPIAEAAAAAPAPITTAPNATHAPGVTP